MRDSKSIIEEYRNADFEKRVYLFLSHRSLRDEFLEIDQDNTAVGPKLSVSNSDRAIKKIM